MYIMFVYKNGKVINCMGIRGNIDELYNKAFEMTKEAHKEEPTAEITTKIKFFG